jgi:aspartate/methionine/tyrosine aminotransferase
MINIKDVNPAVIETEYAVRGRIPIRAKQLEEKGEIIIYCNIGNPQAFDQKRLTYVRQILSLCENPNLIESPPEDYPADVIGIAHAIVHASGGLGAYSESKGVCFIREAVAKFIGERDGTTGIDPESIYFTNGATEGIDNVLELLIDKDRKTGVMIPAPGYSLYDATIKRRHGKIVRYYPDEKREWKLSLERLEDSLKKAKEQGTDVRAICVINPNNPTGAVLSREEIEMILNLARKNNLTVLADEVYQENLYNDKKQFISFGKVLQEQEESLKKQNKVLELKDKDRVSLFSFNSCSKDYLGECGARGGYVECRNVPEDVQAELLKQFSMRLCPNLAGQVLVHALVCPPKKGELSYDLYMQEKTNILEEYKKRAGILFEGLNKIEGISCNPIDGALYAFVRIKLPPSKTDDDYCMALLEKTGICVVPGSGFGQEEGTFHFRMTILPPTDQIIKIVEKLKVFQEEYCNAVTSEE